MDLIRSAFLLLIKQSLPIYKTNIDHKRPPVAARENVNAAAAIVLVTTALDYHVCRLKYLRDVAKHDPPLPYTPYFLWTFGDPLSKKLKGLLISAKDRRLLDQLIELTVCRDSIIHPKFHTITHVLDADHELKKLKAQLPPNTIVRKKESRHKMKRMELTRLLRLPLVPTWVSYVDAILCILVLHRFFNLIEKRYGNPYGWIGGMTAYEREAKNLFTGWNWEDHFPGELNDWVQAFYKSVSANDQERIRKRLGGHVSHYLEKPKTRIKRSKTSKRQSLADIFAATTTKKPSFLFSPPPQPTQKTSP